MKDSIPTLASVFIIGTFTSVLSVQRNDTNNHWTITNPANLRFRSRPSFGYTAQETSEKTAPISDYGLREFTDKSMNSSENNDRNSGGYKAKEVTVYRKDYGKSNYGFNTRFIFIVSQSVPEHQNSYKSDINYTNKSPIQILPSRFPPPLEKLIQNIQNYFSTYNHPDLQNRPFHPQNPQVATSTEQETYTSHPTEATTEINEEITTEGTEENTVVALT